MEWTKAEIADGARRRASRSSPKGRSARRSTRRTSTTRIEAVERVKKEVAEQLARRFPGQRARTSQRSLGDVEYNALRVAGARHGLARRRPQAERSAPDHDRHAACSRARTARRCSRAARRRRSSPSRSARPTTCSASTRSTSRARRRSRSCCTTTSRRSPRAKFARCAARQPPRDRPRQPRRARAAGRAAGVRGVPVHDSHRLRHSRVERLVVDGVGLRRLARAVRRRRADSRAPSPAWRWD